MKVRVVLFSPCSIITQWVHKNTFPHQTTCNFWFFLSLTLCPFFLFTIMEIQIVIYPWKFLDLKEGSGLPECYCPQSQDNGGLKDQREPQRQISSFLYFHWIQNRFMSSLNQKEEWCLTWVMNDWWCTLPSSGDKKLRDGMNPMKTQ